MTDVDPDLLVRLRAWSRRADVPPELELLLEELPDPSRVRRITDEVGHYLGCEPRACAEHRTVGPHRAWCFDDVEWCYPTDPCRGCGGTP